MFCLILFGFELILQCKNTEVLTFLEFMGSGLGNSSPHYARLTPDNQHRWPITWSTKGFPYPCPSNQHSIQLLPNLGVITNDPCLYKLISLYTNRIVGTMCIRTEYVPVAPWFACEMLYQELQTVPSLRLNSLVSWKYLVKPLYVCR
jgi:hypothetical protein